jgi:MOB kinase activator 1
MAGHMNSCFKHLMYFSFEFGLLPQVEMEPIQILITPIMRLFRLEKRALSKSAEKCER